MFRRLGIAQQIYGSFGLLIALLAAVCVTSFVGLQSIADILANFRQTSTQTAITGSLASRISAAQQAAVAYRVTHDKAQAVGFDNALMLVNFEDESILDAIAANESTATLIGGLKTDLGNLAAAFRPCQ